MRKSFFTLTGVMLLVALAGGLIVAQTGKPRKIRRAQPPDFSKQASDEGIFFSDVFAELEGDRPADLGKPPTQTAGSPTGGANSGGGSDGGGGGFGWSKIVSATAMEDEIKAMKLQLDQEITTPTKFAGSGHKVARRDFTIIAVLYGVIGEYDGDVRWKDVAPAMRDTFARAAANAKVSTPQAYNEAKARLQDLQDLVGGASISTSGQSERQADWSKVCDRSPLMQRLEAGHQGKLQPMTASADEFKKNSDTIQHEANILGAIAAVLTKEGMEDADADDYKGWATNMKNAAHDVVDAVKSNDYDKARKGVGAMGQACSSCHELYR